MSKVIHQGHGKMQRSKIWNQLFFFNHLKAFAVSIVCEWKSLSRVQLCNSVDYTVHGILQARILEWVALPFSRGSSQPRDQTQVSHIAGGFFTSWTTREPLVENYMVRGAWQATVHGVLNSWKQLSDFDFP